MKIIGLTGPSGAGKGVFASYLAARGIPIIDADRVYHELLIPPSPCLDALVSEFGNRILTKDSTLDRSALAALVFANDAAAVSRHETLNRITHRFVAEKIQEQLAQMCSHGHNAAVIDAPLLIEAGLNNICDVVIAVLADRELRLDRLIQREGKDRLTLLSRINAQPDDDFYISNADIVVMNNNNEAHLEAEADAVLMRLELIL